MKKNPLSRAKYKLNHILFSNKFYRLFIKPFDKVLFDIVPTDVISQDRKDSIPLNKICQVADIYNPEWAKTARELKHRIDAAGFHRKDWEHIQIIMALKHLHYLTPNSVCLAIGAGREHLLYYLTYKIKKVYGIDLYGGRYYGGEDESDIPLSTERYAPFPYDHDKLQLFRMDALNLDFPDQKFDFVFSASSIEHFGEKKDILQSLKEMYRVLKPGGIASITTELKLTARGTKSPNVNPFFFQELMSLYHKAGFRVSQDFDLRIEQEYFYNWIKLPEEIYKRPHVILRFFNTVFTSIHAVLHKEGQEALTGEEIFSEIPDFDYNSDILIETDQSFIPPRQTIELSITLTNRGNFKWIPSGTSHRIALGVQLFTENNILFDRDYQTILIPDEVLPGKSIEFKTSLTAPDKKGRWILKFDLKKELVFWFSEKGNSVAEVLIEVT
jgi:SAM-dependent methyltransferase